MKIKKKKIKILNKTKMISKISYFCYTKHNIIHNLAKVFWQNVQLLILITVHFPEKTYQTDQCF